MSLDNPSQNKIITQVVSGVSSANSSFTLPLRATLLQVVASNNTANAVTGGVKFGSTNGGVDIVAALVVAASIISPPATLLLTRFAAAQQIFFDAVGIWNAANIDVTFVYALP